MSLFTLAELDGIFVDFLDACNRIFLYLLPGDTATDNSDETNSDLLHRTLRARPGRGPRH